MRKVNITGTDLQCSILSLGGVPIGSRMDESESFALLDYYVERGGNMVDTAEVYANWLPGEKSASERMIGRWIQARGNRSSLIVTTKGAHHDPNLDEIVPRVTAEAIHVDLEGSLSRLQVDTIDLYWLHRDDPTRPVSELIDALDAAVAAGRIRYYGCSNWSTARIREAQAYAKRKGTRGFIANQMLWTLAAVDMTKNADPTIVAMDEEMKAYHLETAMAAIPFTSQAEGLFAKWLAGTHTYDDSRINPIFRSQETIDRFHRAKQLAVELSLSLSQVVLAYLTSQPFTTVPIIGCRTIEQLEDSLKVEGVTLSERQLDFLENGQR